MDGPTSVGDNRPVARPSILVALVLGAFALLAGAALPSAGVEPGWIHFIWLITGPGPFFLAGAWIVLRRPGNRAGELLTWAALLTLALPFGLEGIVARSISRSGVADWMWIPVALTLVGGLLGVVLLTMLCASLPDGEWDRSGRPKGLRWMWWTVLIGPLVLMTNPLAYHRSIEFDGLEVASPFFVESWAGLGPVSVMAFESHGILILGGMWLVWRRFRESDERDRRRLRWILYGLGTTVVVGIGTYSLGALGAMPLLTHGVLLALLSLPMAVGPLSIAIAVLEPEWIRRDSLARKSLVFSVFSVSVMLLWVGVATAFGVAADDRIGGDLAVVLAVLGAIAFQPARQRLVSWADRTLFGERADPFEVLAGLTEEHPDEVLPRLASTLRDALRLEWVRVIAGDETAMVGSVTGLPEVVVPLIYRETRLGSVECGRKTDRPFGTADRRLIDTLASQAAMAIGSARLAGRIVSAQEEERRRIERNIHDGTQQELVALIARLGMARSQAESDALDPSALSELQAEAQRILGDLRDLAQGIHPSVLSDGGLVEAVEERVASFPGEIRLRVAPALRQARFATDIEGAAWFVVSEGLANALKHAPSARVRVSLLAGENLVVEIADDGPGFDPAAVPERGLAGLRDRCEALGGGLDVESASGSGTTVRAWLPAEAP